MALGESESLEKMAENCISCPSCSSCEIRETSIKENDSMNCCRECASVIDEESTLVHDISSSNFSGSLANANGSCRYGHGFDMRQACRLPAYLIPANKRRLIKAFDTISSKLQVTGATQEEAKSFLLDKVNEHKSFKSTHNKTRLLVGGCLYVTCRKSGVPLTIKQVADACSCSKFRIWGIVKRLEVVFGTKCDPISTPALITSACNYVENSKECEQLAKALYKQTSEAMINLENRFTNAVAHTAIAAVNINRNSTMYKMKEYLCKMTSANSKVVARCLTGIKAFMMSVLSEIPWVNMKYVKDTNIHFYAKDIVKYRKSVGAFKFEAIEPEWYSKKQKPYIARDEKIRKAQERINSKQEQTRNNKGVSKDSDNDLSELDKDDEIIQELLEMGCTPEDIRNGSYDSLRTPTGFEILEEEIDSYVRTPEEVRTLKRIQEDKEKEDEANDVVYKKRQLVNEFCA